MDVLFIQMGNLQCADPRGEGLQKPCRKILRNKSSEQIKKELTEYGQRVRLECYPPDLQLEIEKYFQFGQRNLCDQLVALNKQNRIEELKGFRGEVQKINFQELDYIFYQACRNRDEVAHLIQQQFHIPKVGTNVGGLKMTEKYSCKDYQKYTQIGLNLLKQVEVLLLVPIQCFSGLGCFRETQLTSKKSFFQLLLQKIDAVSSRYEGTLPVLFLINEAFLGEFERNMEEYLLHREQDSEEFAYFPVLYKPEFPCLDYQGEIYIKQGNIQYNFQDGDLIGFLCKNMSVRIYFTKYRFVHYLNVCNVLENIADPFLVGLLADQKLIQIVPKVFIDRQSESSSTLVLKGNFLERSHRQGVKKALSFTDSFMTASSIFSSSTPEFERLLINRFSISQLQPMYFLKRTFEDILFQSITHLVLVDQDREYAHPDFHSVAYSRYCKMVLGLKNTEETELVEIHPEILYGPRENVKNIIEQINQHELIGFPLIASKSPKSNGSEDQSENTF